MSFCLKVIIFVLPTPLGNLFIGFPVFTLANWPLSAMIRAFLFLIGFFRLLTFRIRLRIKRIPPKFQYFRQDSVSNDLPVSTNDLPAVQNFLSDNAFKGYAGNGKFGV